jgi:plastocyanin
MEMVMHQHSRTLARSVVVALLSAGLLAPVAQAADATVTIKSFMFMPKDVKITAGSTVTWTNKDEEPHTVTSDIGLFRSGGIDGGSTFQFKFAKPGVYKYSCSIHPQMMGTITVE